MTARIDVTDLVAFSGRNGMRFYINFLYILQGITAQLGEADLKANLSAAARLTHGSSDGRFSVT